MKEVVESRIIAKDADYCVAVWHRTVIHIWRGEPTGPAVARLVEACKSLLASGSDVTCVGVIERSSPAPDEAARTALARWSRDVVPKMAGAVFVAEGSGFRAALVRGVGVALTTLVPHRVPFKFFGTIGEALQQVVPKLPANSGGVFALKAEIERLRADVK